MAANDIILFRKGSDSQWISANPVLASGEPGYDLTNEILKIGDGVSSWSGLSPVGVGLNNLVEDLSPQLGGNLDLNNRNITGTGNININGSGSFYEISFNTSLGDPDLTIGQLAWNQSEGTLDIGLNDNYNMHLGEEMLYRVRNSTGSTVLAGTPVYASGLTAGGNNRIEIAPHVANGLIREIRFMGLMTENCDTGINGYTTHFGYIRSLDTRGDANANGYSNKLWASGEPIWAEGDILYVHPTIEGKLTKVEPKHSISVAIILNRHQNQGKIFVRPTSYGHLSDNHDVNVSGVAGGQFLQYDSVTDFWIPSNSGNFSSLQVNGTGVSISGHSHLSTDITNFNSSVSGLLPTIANSGDNRILTSTGSTVGINAESNLTFDGTNLTAPYLVSSYSSGDEGGEIQLAKPPNGTLSGGITIDAYQNRLRFFEQGGSARGFYLDLSSAGAGVSTNLAAGGGSATSVSNYADNRVITSDGTTAGLNAESNFTFNGSLLTAPSGNFTSSLQVNSINVSISGHNHSSSDITDFNSSVSGLLPVTNIVAGTGMMVSSSSGSFTVNLDAYSVLIGNGSATSYTVTHNLGATNDVHVSVRETGTNYYVYPDIKYVNDDSVLIEFVSAPTSNQYRVSIIGF
jgi:hypothetical protein